MAEEHEGEEEQPNNEPDESLPYTIVKDGYMITFHLGGGTTTRRIGGRYPQIVRDEYFVKASW